MSNGLPRIPASLVGLACTFGAPQAFILLGAGCKGSPLYVQPPGTTASPSPGPSTTPSSQIGVESGTAAAPEGAVVNLSADADPTAP